MNPVTVTFPVAVALENLLFTIYPNCVCIVSHALLIHCVSQLSLTPDYWPWLLTLCQPGRQTAPTPGIVDHCYWKMTRRPNDPSGREGNEGILRLPQLAAIISLPLFSEGDRATWAGYWNPRKENWRTLVSQPLWWPRQLPDFPLGWRLLLRPCDIPSWGLLGMTPALLFKWWPTQLSRIHVISRQAFGRRQPVWPSYWDIVPS